MATFNIIGFLTGILIVWLYAAIRSRFGAGPKAALLVALTIWLVGYVFPAVGQAGLGILPAQLMATGTGLGLIEVILAALAGASIYKEDAGEVPAVRAATAH